jgi:hypothetical protein
MSLPTAAINDWNVGQALASVQRLVELLPGLTEDEVMAALELESRSRRRRSVIDRLIARAVRINELNYSSTLRKKYGTPT